MVSLKFGITEHGAHSDIRVMKMNPPADYICLGHVAVLGYDSTPDTKQYQYLTLRFALLFKNYYTFILAIPISFFVLGMFT